MQLAITKPHAAMSWHCISMDSTHAMNIPGGVLIRVGDSLLRVEKIFVMQRWVAERIGEQVFCNREFRLGTLIDTRHARTSPFAWCDADDNLPEPTLDQVLAEIGPPSEQGGPEAQAPVVTAIGEISLALLRDVPTIKIGKLKTSTIYVDDDLVMRMHAVIERDDDGNAEVVDLGIRRTWVNGKLVDKSAPIKPGDILRVGNTDLRITE